MIAIRQFFSGFEKAVLYRLGIFIFLYVVVLTFGIFPNLKQLNEIKSSRTTSVEARTRALGGARGVVQLSQDGLKLRAFLEDISNRTADEKEVKNILGEISKRASKAGVKITEITPFEMTYDAGEPFKEFCEVQTFELNIEGAFHSLGAFVQSLEMYPKLVRIAALKIVPDAKSEKSHKASLILSLFAKKKELLPAYQIVV